MNTPNISKSEIVNHVMIILLALFRIKFDSALAIPTTYLRQNTQANQILSVKAQNYKKLSTMTPLQTLCSFQTWNARPISETLHERSVVSKMC